MKVSEIISNGTKLKFDKHLADALVFLDQKFERMTESELKDWLSTHGSILNRKQAVEVLKQTKIGPQILMDVEDVLHKLEDYFNLPQTQVKKTN